jgi:hypothetical protein
MTSCDVRSSSRFVSIQDAGSQSMIVDTCGYEKSGTPIISIDDLKVIGRIVRPIKARIEGAGTNTTIPSSLGAHLAVGSYAAFSETGSAYIAQ